MDEHRGARAVDAHGYAHLVAGEPARQAAVGLAHGVRGGHGPIGLVDPHAPRKHHAVLNPREHCEELGHPVRDGGSRPPVFPGHGGDALEGEHLQHEVGPCRDGQLPALEDGARGRRRALAAGAAEVPLDPRAREARPDDRAAAEGALRTGIAVEEVGVAGEPLVAERVDGSLAGRDGGLGRRELLVRHAVPRRRRGRAPAPLVSAHGGSPVRRGGRRRQDYHIR